jgi:hypothetical protein
VAQPFAGIRSRRLTSHSIAIRMPHTVLIARADIQ